jgi:hypothetical protein
MPTFMADWYRAHPINDAYRDIRARVDDDYKKLTSKIFFFFCRFDFAHDYSSI